MFGLKYSEVQWFYTKIPLIEYYLGQVSINYSTVYLALTGSRAFYDLDLKFVGPYWMGIHVKN